LKSPYGRRISASFNINITLKPKIMNLETLKTAIALKNKIDNLQYCFDSFTMGVDEHGYPTSEKPFRTVSREPRLIIDCISEDWEGRSQVPIPMELNDEMTGILMSWINAELQKTSEQLIAL
jgi:hypothetical protein